MKRSRSFLRYRRGSRDANHAAIRDGLRKLGYFVVDTSGVGDGVPDLLVFSSGLNPSLQAVTWLELKVGKAKERESQRKWRERAERCGIAVRTTRSFEEALVAVAERPEASWREQESLP